MKRTFIICILALVAIWLWFPTDRSGQTSTARDATKSDHSKRDGELTDPPRVDGKERPGGLSPEPAPPIASGNRQFVKKILSSDWVDREEKTADRRRVRVVEADFKYPMLRLEESVTTDPDTGEEIFRLIRASVADHVMVGLKPGTDIAAARLLLETNGYRIRSVEPDSFVIAALPEATGADAQPEAIREISGLDEFISFAEPDYIVFPSLAANDPDYASGKMWGLNNRGNEAGSVADADIDAPEAWELRNSAPGVVVAVTDTGIQYDHEDLRDNMWSHPTSGVHGFDAYEDDYDPMDTGGHGTHCAGTIGARGNNSIGMTGVAWQVQLMALRFLGPNGGSTSDGIRVINYARQNGADIISASWGGGGYSQGLYNAINECRAADIPFVAAAGNDGTNNDSIPHYPSSYELPNIVAVASTTKSDNLSSFSCYGRHSVDIAAPGSSIWSSYIGGNSSYEYLNGTSMATPHVSGALALAKAHFPGESHSQLIERLYSSADRVNALSQKTYSGGRLNLDRLLRGLQPSKRHDDFADALRFENGYGRWSGTSADATHEPDEWSFSVNGLGNQSLWFAFNSGSGGLVSLDCQSPTPGFNMVTFEGGTKGSLLPVAYSNAVSSYNRQIRFTAKPNTEYRVLLDTYNAGGQIFSLAFSQTPGNDFFASATPVEGRAFNVTGTNRGATPEIFELKAPHAGVGQGKSVWWRWVATKTEDFTFSTSGSDFDTVLAVYSGSQPGNLVSVASNDDRSSLDYTSQTTFRAVENTTYHIAVDSYRRESAGNISLHGFRSGTLNIIRQPVGLSVELGKRAVFDVSVLSGGGVSYQWFLNDHAITGQTAANLVIDPIRASDFGNYKVEVRNSENIVLSDTAILSELQTPPRLVWSSGNQAVAIGTAVTLAANFSGSETITYTWTKNGEPIPGDTPSLAFPDAQVADAGAYHLTATNAVGTATADFTLSVVQSPWERWEWRRPGISNAAITDIKVYGGEAFAVAGTTLFRSIDGENWTKSVFPDGFIARSIAKAAGLIICIGHDPNNVVTVATSTDDAATWALTPTTGYAAFSQYEAHTITPFGAVFLAYTHAGSNVLHSTDGMTWATLNATNLAGNSVTLRGKGAMATDGTTIILASHTSNSNYKSRFFKSTDGFTWTEHETSAGTNAFATRFPQTAAYAMGKFHLIDTYAIYTSEDATNWDWLHASGNSFASTSLFASNGESLIALQGNTDVFRHYIDPAVRFSRRVNPTNSHVFTAAASFGNKILFGTDKGLLASAAGPNDIRFPKEQFTTLSALEFLDDIFIARTPGAGSTLADLTSGDGVTWKAGPVLDSPVITHSGRAFGKTWGTRSDVTAIHVGHNPFDVRRDDRVDIGLAPNITFIDQLPNGNALAVSSVPSGPSGYVSTIHTRVAGASSWTPATFPTSVGTATKFASLGDRWYSSGGTIDPGPIYSSADGGTWTNTGLSGGKAQFVSLPGKHWCIYQSMAYPSKILSAESTDGINWTPRTPSGLPNVLFNYFIKRVVGYDGYLVILDSQENLYFSEDGVYWIRGYTPGKVADIAAGNGQLVAIMKNGGIIQTGVPNPGGGAPMISIVSPQTSSTHLLGSRITIEGTVSDPQDGAASYECYFDSELVASGTGTTFRFDVTATDLNGHTVTVRSADSHGLRQMDSVRLRVVAPVPKNLLAGDEGKTHVPQGFATTFDGVFYTAGSRVVYRSFDGVTWESVPIPSFSNPIHGMASGNGALVIQFTNGGIITTRDGINWTHFQPNLTDYWVREPVRFSSGVFVAAYQTQGTTSGSVMTSTDGLRWNVGFISGDGYLSWSANSPDGTIIGSQGSLNGINRSTDGGFNWFPVAPLSLGTLYNSYGIYADGKFVVTISGTVNQVFVSEDSINWSSQPLPTGVFQVSALAHIGGKFFIGRTPDFTHVSPDGLTWQPMSHVLHRHKITYSRGLFVAHSTASGMLTSRDGMTWTPVPGLPAGVSKILSNESTYLVIDSIGGVWSSVDGIDWVAALPGKTSAISSNAIGYSIDQLGGTLVAAGSALLVTSAGDGRAWANANINGQAPATNRIYHKVVSSGAEFLVLEGHSNGGDGLLRSTDGIAFSSIPNLPAKTWRDLAWNGTEWMLVASDGSLHRSLDGGLTWTDLAVTGITRAASLAWFEGRWIVIGAVTNSNSSPYVCYTLETDDTLENRGGIGLSTSGNQARAQVAHGRLIVWMRGAAAVVSEDGHTWSTTNLIAGAGNHDYDIIHTADGFTAFVGSGGDSPIRTWTSGSDGLIWRETPPAFHNIQYADNLGARIFLFTHGNIAELHDKDLALTLPSLPTVTLGVGDKVEASVTVTNYGRAVPVASKWRITAWLAKNRFYGDTKNMPIGTFDLSDPMPAPGDSVAHDVSFTLPNNILTGDNFLILSLSSVDGVSESNTANNTVISETAAINIPEWEFSVATNGNGQVNRDFAASRYPHKSQVSLTASAGKGAAFTGWAGDALSPNNQITVLMDGDKSVQANFSGQAALQLFVRGMGTVTGLADLGSYTLGTTAELSAEPAQGWTFSHWSGASSDTTATTSILMDSPKVLTAIFVRSLSDWKQSVFNVDEMADSSISADGSDPDGDGLENWQEHLHGSNPTDRTSTGVVSVTLDGDFLRCVYTRLSSPASGTPIRCEAGRAMTDWDSPDLEERVISSVDGIETIESRMPHGTHPSGFIRFRYVPETPE